MPKRPSVSQSVKEYLRGIIGGLIFSLPILFTMEMWWSGFTTSPILLLAYIIITYGLLIGYNRFAGMRQDSSWLEVAIDSVEEIGIGMFIAFITLWMIGVIDFANMSWEEIAGKVIIEAMTVAIGVSVGTAQLGESNEEDTGMKGLGESALVEGKPVNLFSKATMSLCGAVLFAANVAPTDEIVIIATESSILQLLILAIFSLLLSITVFFLSDFKGTNPGELPKGSRFSIFQLVTEVALAYSIALGASAAILGFFGRFDGVDLKTAVAEIVVLAVAGSIGASAGKLLLKG